VSQRRGEGAVDGSGSMLLCVIVQQEGLPSLSAPSVALAHLSHLGCFTTLCLLLSSSLLKGSTSFDAGQRAARLLPAGLAGSAGASRCVLLSGWEWRKLRLFAFSAKAAPAPWPPVKPTAPRGKREQPLLWVRGRERVSGAPS